MLARYANDRLCETDDNARAEWVNGKIKIIAKEDIAASDEITYSYWRDFWIKNRDSLSKSARQKMIFYHNVKEHEMIYRTYFDSQGKNKDAMNSSMITNPTMQLREKISLMADRTLIVAFDVEKKTPSAACAGGRGKNESRPQIVTQWQAGFFSFGPTYYLGGTIN